MQPVSSSSICEARPARVEPDAALRLLRENLFIVAVVTVYTALGVAAGDLLDWRNPVQPFAGLASIARLAGLFVLGFLAVQCGRRILAMRAGFADLGAVARRMHADYLAPDRVGGFVLIVASLVPFVATFSRLKQAIPDVVPFRWDPLLADIDRAVHFGHDPWVLLQPLVGHPVVTVALDNLYVAWFGLLLSTILWMGWTTRRTLRRQFLWSLLVNWTIMGTAAAMVLSSAGPCYYAHVTGDTLRFAGLFSYLHEVDALHPLWAIHAQAGLWEALQAGAFAPLAGISAMPSMHVAGAVQLALVGWSVNRPLGVLLTAYAVAVQVGSVALGWHYAIDGYASALATVAVWKLIGWVLARRERAA